MRSGKRLRAGTHRRSPGGLTQTGSVTSPARDVTNTVVNRTTVINVYENRSARNLTYINRAAPNALSVVSRETFVTSRPVGHLRQQFHGA